MNAAIDTTSHVKVMLLNNGCKVQVYHVP